MDKFLEKLLKAVENEMFDSNCKIVFERTKGDLTNKVQIEGNGQQVQKGITTILYHFLSSSPESIRKPIFDSIIEDVNELLEDDKHEKDDD